MTRIVCFGPGPQFKGGISNYNTSLAKALAALPDVEVHIVSWTQQYPAIIPRDFIDRKSRADLLAGTGIRVHYLTNYNNPFTWARTVRFIRALKADKVIFQWAIALQGLPLGWMARRLMRNTEVIFDLHLVRQKEASGIDKAFTTYGLSTAHSYIVHAEKTAGELEALLPSLRFRRVSSNTPAPAGERNIVKLYHPVYDMFRPDAGFDVAAEKARLGLKTHVLLFFGFIRKYKGLHWVIEAFAEVVKQRQDVSLLIVGESFWQTLDGARLSTRIKKALFGAAKRLVLRSSDDEADYNPLALIDHFGLGDRVVVNNEFVPNEQVHRYFQVANAILLYYLTATPSGVESIAYNFGLPMLATRVGHFPETVVPGYNGYLAEPGDIYSMAEMMLKVIQDPIPRANIDATASKLSWANYAKAVLGLLN